MMTIAKWRSLPVLIALLLPQSGDTKTERTPLERLQAKIDVVSVQDLTPSELAGQYTNPSEELSKRVPPMGSEKLFVFPDRSYIFTFATNIPPDTISDKGTWSLNGDTLELQSDKDVTWKSKHVERQHLVEFFSFVFLSSLHRRPRLVCNLAIGFSPTQTSLRSQLRP
jgi:hypothetical protein